jgi:polysaccharide biosynthesis transport protein
MLQDNKSDTISNDLQPVGAEQMGVVEVILWAVGLIRRQYPVVIFVASLVIGAGLIYLRIAPPTYTAQASLVVDLHRNPIAQQEGIFSNDPIEIESQIQIIKSDSIASAVIQKLQLMNDPELAPGIISHLIGLLHGGKAGTSSDPVGAIIAQFESRITVEQAGGRVITVKYSSKDPNRAAQVANAIVNAYLTEQMDAKYESSRIAGGWVQERQRQLREEADAAERAVESFKKQNNIVISDGKPIDDKQIDELNNRLITAKTKTSDLSARLNHLQTIIRLGPSNPNMDGTISDVNSPIMTSLRQQYLELARRESEWSARFGHDHLAVVNLRNRMQEIRQSIFDELRRTAETAKNDYDVARQQQDDIKKQLDNTIAQSRIENQALAPLHALETTAATYRDRYKSFLQQFMGATQQATFPVPDARLISPASPQLLQVKPRPLLVLILSIIGGIGLGFGLAILRDLMDRVFRTAKQLEETLQVPCIAVVPLLKDVHTKQPARKLLTPRGNENGRTPRGNENGRVIKDVHADVFWTVVNSPLSQFSEAIRSIRLAVDLDKAGAACKVVGFTSAIPNEGKSTLAAALAQLIAQARGRVVLVDCDLRNPTLSKILAPGASLGIIDVLSGRCSVAEAILREPKTNMAVLPTGKKIPLFLTSDLLSGEPMSKLFEALRKQYDYIVVDLPPLAPIVDVRAATHLIDSVVLAVAWGETKIGIVEHALRSAPGVYDLLIGTVLNKTNMNFITSYDATGRYEYNKHYARYGYTD